MILERQTFCMEFTKYVDRIRTKSLQLLASALLTMLHVSNLLVLCEFLKNELVMLFKTLSIESKHNASVVLLVALNVI